MATSGILSPPALRSPALKITAIVTTGIAGAVMVIMMPGVLAALSSARRLSASQVALLASSEMGGVTAATIIISGWIARLDRRRAAAVTLSVLMACNLGSFLVSDFSPLLATRFVAGVCEGALLGIMSASITTTSSPDRVFAIFLAGNLTTSTVLLKLLGYLSASGHETAIFLVLMAVAAVPLVLLPFLPARLREGVAAGASTPERISDIRSGIFGLAGTFVLQLGVGLTWPFVGALGLQRHFTAETVAGILSVSTTVGICAAIFVYVLGPRAGRRLPIIVGSLGLALAILGLMVGVNQVNFTVAACAFMFFWVAVNPFFSGVMATLDPSGRLATLFMGMQFAGLTVGPMLATSVVKSQPAAPFWLGIACCVLAIGLMTPAERGARRIDGETL